MNLEISTETKISKPPFRILVVEDDRVTFMALALLLKHYRFEVDVAETLALARQKIIDGVDFICLDLLLPDGDGIDLLQQLKRTKSAPVAVITATDDPNRLRRVRNLMPDRLFKKPVDFLELLDVIKRASATERPVSTQSAKVTLF